MKLTNFSIVNIISTLKEFEDKKLPQKISYAITRNLMILEKDYNCYIKELNKIFEKYQNDFVKGEDGEIINDDTGLPIVDSDIADDYKNEISSLLNIELDVYIYTISLDCFDYEDEKGRYDALSAKDILKLQSILCTEEKDN